MAADEPVTAGAPIVRSSTADMVGFGGGAVFVASRLPAVRGTATAGVP